ncbi:MAG: putative metal-binding motif-containing protein [Myxococcales bacterium]|nr:putative metal-binding motif-containing protein [Myxococcales bacterium]
MTRLRSTFLLLCLLVACGDDDGILLDAGADAPPPPDAGPRDGGPPQCTDDSECDNDAFCDGSPTCDPASPFADENGCVASTESPCAEGLFCDETADRCLTACEREGDADEDGFVSEACDDDDCDDSSNAARPGATETCDGVDQDCDDTIDEEVGTLSFRDLDGDGYGAADTARWLCAAEDGWVTLGTDCDDTLGAVNPGNAEVCEGSIDENCDGTVDEGCDL